MKFILTFITMLFLGTAMALPLPADVAFMLNKGNVNYAPLKLGDQVVLNKVQTARCTYTVSIQGGSTVATKKLKATDGSDCVIPNKAIVIKVLVDVVSTMVGPSATLSLGTLPGGATVLKSSTAVASFTGLMDGTPAYTAATSFKTTANVNPILTVGTAPLTSGKFNVFISYVLSE